MPKQYQMIKISFRYHTKGVSNQVLSNSDHEIKLLMFTFQYQSRKKRTSGKKFSGLQTEAMRGLQIGAGFKDYRLGQEGLQIGAALGISNRGKKITNYGRDFKSGQRDFKLEQRLKIGARRISNQGRDYKSGQNNMEKTLHTKMNFMLKMKPHLARTNFLHVNTFVSRSINFLHSSEIQRR